MQRKFFKKINKKEKAFISIFAIFFSAIVVSVLTALYVLFLKELQTMNLDYNSFQAVYVADSAFECAVYKETVASGTLSVFRPENSGGLGNCENSGDLTWQQTPTTVGNRATSIFLFNMPTPQGDFCGYGQVEKEINDSQTNHNMYIKGQSRKCDQNIKVVEREIDFVY